MILMDAFDKSNTIKTPEDEFHDWLEANHIDAVYNGDNIVYQKQFYAKTVSVSYDPLKLTIVEGAEEPFFNDLKTQLSDHFKLNTDEKVDADGYKINLEPYCAGCMDFEPKVALPDSHINVNGVAKVIDICRISCVHSKKCKNMYERLKKKG